MFTETSAVAFRQNLGAMLNGVQYRKDSILSMAEMDSATALVREHADSGAAMPIPGKRVWCPGGDSNFRRRSK
jgi:hypothetical protein